ncbi:MAG TPA: hypothetical protein VH351_21680, partial [Bryobacteraceae bacterium]|nr:hypothetical protein [Bryobacteraceae bacterium]
MEKRRMCPNCRAFITITDRVCPYCNVQLGPRVVDTRASQLVASFLPRANLTSIVILSLNCFFFLIELIFNMKYGVGGFSDISGAILHVLGAKYG